MMTSSHQIPRRINPPAPSTAIKCPRCDSMNTKFCYYNNYSLSQPRHFCKNCRRYWTRGGSLRNIPIGGSTRQKNKLSGDPFPPSSLFSFQTTSYSPVISSGGFSSYIDPNFVSLNQDLLRKIQQQRIVTSMFLQDSSPVTEKPLTAPVPAPVMIPPLAGWGFEISGNNENSGNGEGNLENWYCNGMP